jgi:hypothetical protein
MMRVVATLARAAAARAQDSLALRPHDAAMNKALGLKGEGRLEAPNLSVPKFDRARDIA